MPATTLDLATLKTNNSWADGQRLTEAKIDAIMGITGTTGIQDWADDTVDNLNQFRLDGFGSAYTLDNDAVANFTSSITLYNKQVVVDTYSTNILLGTATDVDYVDVDAVNAAIVFTPNLLAGDYKVTFQFTDHSIGTAAVDTDCETAFRLTDGTTNSNPIRVQHRVDGTGLAAGDQTEFQIPVSIMHVFTGLAAGTAVTVRLQKRVLTATAVATHDTDAAVTNVMYMVAEKI